MAGHVYHWKHGWIPLDAVAALSKAHGSHKSAARVMERHGITPGGHHEHGVVATHHAPSGASHRPSAAHAVGSRVTARQPGGQPVEGRVVGHTAEGHVRVEHTTGTGRTVVGTFAAGHVQPRGGAAPAAARAEPHAAPHTLTPGEHATVRGVDQYGKPMSLTGTVVANGESSKGGVGMRTIAVKRPDNSQRVNHVHVVDPARPTVARRSNADALAQARGASAPSVSASRDHTAGNLAALSVRKGQDGKGYEVAHTPSGRAITRHDTKAEAEQTRGELAAIPHDLSSSESTITSDPAVRAAATKVASGSQQRQGEARQHASMVAAAKRQRPAAPTKVANPSKPGDFVVVTSTRHDYVAGQGRVERTEHTPGVVTHVHSDGTPIAYRDAAGHFNTVRPGEQTRVAPQSEVNAPAALRDFAGKNKWSNGSTRASTSDLASVQAVAGAHRVSPAPPAEPKAPSAPRAPRAAKAAAEPQALSEFHGGEHITVRKVDANNHEVLVNGHQHEVLPGTSAADMHESLAETRTTIDHVKGNLGQYTSPSGDTLYGIRAKGATGYHPQAEAAHHAVEAAARGTRKRDERQARMEDYRVARHAYEQRREAETAGWKTEKREFDANNRGGLTLKSHLQSSREVGHEFAQRTPAAWTRMSGADLRGLAKLGDPGASAELQRRLDKHAAKTTAKAGA